MSDRHVTPYALIHDWQTTDHVCARCAGTFGRLEETDQPDVTIYRCWCGKVDRIVQCAYPGCELPSTVLTVSYPADGGPSRPETRSCALHTLWAYNQSRPPGLRLADSIE